uniref:ATP synthase subunit a n=1 Tax=Magnusiomyces magnusii TaxID=43963 RepID=K9L3A9_MAGMU|nr:Atp6p [Magnusiomyces magnusii]AEY71957.2 Atp6p [Magnusiomyces magnusii]AHY04988.1 ATP synthase F0 subunit a [Magnusiomyces magnusii]
MFINSPLEQFEINTYISLTSSIADFSWLSLTNFGVYTIIVFSIVIALHTLSIGNNGIIPTKWSIGIESLYSTIQNMVYSQIGISGQQYFPLIYVIFIFILISNLFSMIPYNFALMSHLVFTISLSSIIWLGVTILGFYNFKLEYFGLFVPAGTLLPLVPILVIIELLSYTARSISLGLRLGSNILAGHLLLVILGGLIFDFMSSGIVFFIVGFIPLGLVLGIMCLECAIGLIQAYVFSILACSYIKEAIYLH